MDIHICADLAYLKGLVVTVESLLANAQAPCRVRLTVEGMCAATIDRLQRQWTNHPRLASLAIHSLSHVPRTYHGNSHFSRAAFGKICLSEVWHDSGGPVLVLDPDTIVERDVCQLATVDMADAVIGVARPLDESTFNSGVMLTNLGEWKSRGIEAALRQSWRLNPHVRCAEQDLLHRVLRDEWLCWLGAEWNQPSAQWSPGDAAIVHCLGGRKPWHGDYRGSAAVRKRFFHYLDRTFLRGQREWVMTGSLKRRLNKWRIRRDRAA